jgi:hypothetical protein
MSPGLVSVGLLSPIHTGGAAWSYCQDLWIKIF